MTMPGSESSLVYVWVWLPGATVPVLAGRLEPGDGLIRFRYARQYMAATGSIPLSLADLPLVGGPIAPMVGDVAGIVADAGPDAWGLRVLFGRDDITDVGLPRALLASGSDRIGALDFQSSPDDYVPRLGGTSTLEELVSSAQRVEEGTPLSWALDRALLHGTSVGGARPKALLTDGARSLIAKFSTIGDTYPVVQGEFLAMEMARRAGLDVPPVELRRVVDRDVLLVERFDRPSDGGRRLMVSALTVLGLDVLGARCGSYADLAHIVRARFTEPARTLRELFARITFNVLTGNTDDHPRNHAAFWDGRVLSLTPAYDICPQPRAGGEAAQIMAIGEDGFRMSQLAGCVARAPTYHVSTTEARGIIDAQIDTIVDGWEEVGDLARLTAAERGRFWHRQFLNPYAFEGFQRLLPEPRRP